MQVLNKPHTPMWRDPDYIRITERDQRFRVVLGGMTLACMLCLMVPDRLDYEQAISFQLAEGAISARLLFGTMFVTLAYLTVRLWLWRSRLTSAATLGIVAALATIATTNPASVTHNAVFVTLALMLLLGHTILFYAHLDPKLFCCALGSLLGIFVCPFNLGMGERMIIVSSCVTLNVMYYGYLDP